MKFSAGLLALTTILNASVATADSWADCSRSRDDARAAIEGCTQIIESSGVANEEKAKAFLNRGNAYQTRSNLADAIADYGEAIRLNPQFALAFNNRGVAHRLQGNLKRAVADLDEAIRLEPLFSLAMYNRGLAHLVSGDVGRAIADYDEAIRLAPQYRDGFYETRCNGGPPIQLYVDAAFNTH